MTTANDAAAPEIDQELEMLNDNKRVAKARLFKARQELREAETACRAADLALEWHHSRKPPARKPTPAAV